MDSTGEKQSGGRAGRRVLVRIREGGRPETRKARFAAEAGSC